ncbi:hypothetical protein [Gluconobacter sp. P5B12]|uniref:hypothetical protein n=1 Tax=Gluconobacter sp. P5B12 TaxID=2762618 RepID=UPI001C054D17|nr:hypothetical protein [Gluconobacter sp. P5B12]
MRRSRKSEPDLLDRLKTGANPFGGIGNRRFLDLLADGEQHFVCYNAVGEAEHLDVTDLGVTIRSLSTIRFPVGVSFWEWEPNGTERLPPLRKNSVPTRCGFLVIADQSGQRGMLHYADYRPRMKLHGRPMAIVYPVSLTFDLRDDCASPDTPLFFGDESHYARQPDLPPEALTAFDVEASPKDAAALMSHFGAMPSPLYKNNPEQAFPQDVSLYSSKDWELFQSLANDLIHEATPFMCMQLLIRASHVRSWTTDHGSGTGVRKITLYDTEVLTT